jgi:hypothetical protein
MGEKWKAMKSIRESRKDERGWRITLYAKDTVERRGKNDDKMDMEDKTTRDTRSKEISVLKNKL